MNLESIRTVFQIVSRPVSFVGEFPRLAHDAKARSEPIGERGADNEAARLDPQNHIDGLRAITIREQVYSLSKKPAIAEERSNIFEDDAGFRKVGDVPDRLADFSNFFLHEVQLPQSPQVRKHGTLSRYPQTCRAVSTTTSSFLF